MNARSSVPSHHDGDLMFLTDAYHSLFDHELAQGKFTKGKQKQDGLFLERLDSFMEGQFRDIETFANREQRSLDEIRELVAIPHAKFIFSKDLSLSPQASETPQQSNSTIPSIRSTIARISSALQALNSAAGLDSLLLVVSPRHSPPSSTASNSSNKAQKYFQPSISSEVSEASWIGGTELGKDFWMGLKGGGMNGIRAFRIKSQVRREAELHPPNVFDATLPSIPLPPYAMSPMDTAGAPTLRVRSGDIKMELNALVRQALRSVSGNPSAEMRWTKHNSLGDLYDVQLVGWPSTLEMRNPSDNSLKTNRLLLDLMRSGEMKFIKRGSAELSTRSASAPRFDKDQEHPATPPVPPATLHPPITTTIVQSTDAAADIPTSSSSTSNQSNRSGSLPATNTSVETKVPKRRAGEENIDCEVRRHMKQSRLGTGSRADNPSDRRGN